MLGVEWWYLSFADERGFLGACIVEADPALAVPDRPGAPGGGSHPITCAIRRAHQLKINPGGQVAGIPLPPGRLPEVRLLNRLLTREEVGKL